MKFIPRGSALLVGIISLMAAHAAVAGPGRTAISGVPNIQGREIEQFLLVDYVRVSTSTNAGGVSASTSACVMVPGQFVAASEDARGVYYQAVNGFRRSHDPSHVIAGGVYVGRTGKNSMLAYLGDARDLAAPVNVLSHRPMIVDDMKKFQVAKSGSAKPPKK